jgi:hypothetical protein
MAWDHSKCGGGVEMHCMENVSSHLTNNYESMSRLDKQVLQAIMERILESWYKK